MLHTPRTCVVFNRYLWRVLLSNYYYHKSYNIIPYVFFSKFGTSSAKVYDFAMGFQYFALTHLEHDVLLLSHTTLIFCTWYIIHVLSVLETDKAGLSQFQIRVFSQT